MAAFLYNLTLFLATPFVVAFHLYRSISRGRPAAMAERFGLLPTGQRQTLAGWDTIWVHAVSVGETIASRPLLRALRGRFPGKRIVLSNVTETGRTIARDMAEVDLSIYFPFDYRFAVDRVLDAVDPVLIVIVETEIWPNLIARARERGVPVVLANGRISDRSFRRYRRLTWLFRPALESFSALCMQTGEDARRITAMGAPPGLVHLAGNIKYDIPVAPADGDRRDGARRGYLIPPTLLVLTAGSTHPGEEEAVISCYKELARENGDLFLVLAPRHPERGAAVAELLRREGIPHTLRSRLGECSAPFAGGQVLLLDTVGELTRLYALSDLVFVGGSLTPVGGHNILEPASFRVPVLFGPHMGNFREIAARMLKAGGALEVADGEALTAMVRALLLDGGRRRAMGENGARLLEENGGSTGRHVEVIASLLGE